MYVYMGLSHLLPCPKPALLPHNQTRLSQASHSRHVCYVTQQTCQLWATADMSAASHGTHVCCVRKQPEAGHVQTWTNHCMHNANTTLP